MELKEKEKDSVFSDICSASKLEDAEKVYLQAERMEQKPGEELRILTSSVPDSHPTCISVLSLQETPWTLMTNSLHSESADSTPIH